MADNLFDMWENMDADIPSGSSEAEKELEEKLNEPTGIVEKNPEDYVEPDITPEDEEIIEDPIVDEDIDEDLPDGEFSFNPLINDLRENEVLLLEDEDLKDFDGKSIEKVRELVDKSVDRKLKAKLDAIDPLAAKVLELAEKGAPIEEAFNTASSIVDFDAVDVSDRDNQRNLISDHLSAQGYDEEYIEEKLSDLEDLDKLEKEAKVAVKFLKKQQDEYVKAYEESITQKKIADEKAFEDEVKEVKRTIDTMDEIAGFKLTKAEKAAFKDYLFKPVTKDGLTQADIDNSTENKLKKEFMNFKKFNFESVQKQAKSKVAKDVYKSLTNYKDHNASGTSDFSGKQAKDSSVIAGLPWLQNGF